MSLHENLMPVAVNLRTLRWALSRASHVRPTALATLHLNDPGLTEPIWAIVRNETPLRMLPQDRPADRWPNVSIRRAFRGIPCTASRVVVYTEPPSLNRPRLSTYAPWTKPGVAFTESRRRLVSGSRTVSRSLLAPPDMLKVASQMVSEPTQGRLTCAAAGAARAPTRAPAITTTTKARLEPCIYCLLEEGVRIRMRTSTSRRCSAQAENESRQETGACGRTRACAFPTPASSCSSGPPARGRRTGRGSGSTPTRSCRPTGCG